MGVGAWPSHRGLFRERLFPDLKHLPGPQAASPKHSLANPRNRYCDACACRRRKTANTTLDFCNAGFRDSHRGCNCNQHPHGAMEHPPQPHRADLSGFCACAARGNPRRHDCRIPRIPIQRRRCHGDNRRFRSLSIRQRTANGSRQIRNAPPAPPGRDVSHPPRLAVPGQRLFDPLNQCAPIHRFRQNIHRSLHHRGPDLGGNFVQAG